MTRLGLGLALTYIYIYIFICFLFNFFPELETSIQDTLRTGYIPETNVEQKRIH